MLTNRLTFSALLLGQVLIHSPVVAQGTVGAPDGAKHFSEVFQRVVFPDSGNSRVLGKQLIRVRTRSVVISFDESTLALSRYDNFIQAVLDEVGRRSNIEILFSSGRSGDIKVFAEPPREWPVIFPEFGYSVELSADLLVNEADGTPRQCLGLVQRNDRRFELTGGVIFIDPEREEHSIRNCIVREFLRHFGLMSEYVGDERTGGLRSLFDRSQSHTVDGVLEVDGAILSALYSDRVFAGMSRSEALKVVEQDYREQ